MAARLPGDAAAWTSGADKAYDTREFVAGLREWSVTPQVARTTTAGGAASTIGPRGMTDIFRVRRNGY
jgi:hypothetical protein